MNIVKRLQQYRRKRTMKADIGQVRTLLGQTYGGAEYYTPDQTISVVTAAEIPLHDLRYVLAIYSTPEDFAAWITTTMPIYDYWEVRREIADLFFYGNIMFTRQEITNLIAPAENEPHDTGLNNFCDSP